MQRANMRTDRRIGAHLSHRQMRIESVALKDHRAGALLETLDMRESHFFDQASGDRVALPPSITTPQPN
jgi:hypothetical protein